MNQNAPEGVAACAARMYGQPKHQTWLREDDEMRAHRMQMYGVVLGQSARLYARELRRRREDR